MESIFAPAIKSIGTILLIFVFLAVLIFDAFWRVPLEQGTRWFWIKVVVTFSAVLAVFFWILLVVYEK